MVQCQQSRCDQRHQDVGCRIRAGQHSICLSVSGGGFGHRTVGSNLKVTYFGGNADINRTELFLGDMKNEAAFMKTIPLGRGATPDDVANVCNFLASDEAAFITGNAIEVDGGRCV